MAKQFDILIIDDEQVIIDSVIKICSSEDWTVDSALDATSALKKIKKNRYRLIICDIMMPDFDGFQFLEQMHAENIHTPVIMTTGYTTVENAVKSLYSGAIDFLAKPFTIEELISISQRGLKYGEILESMDRSMQRSPDPASIPYVPCPAQYHRLGYSSWAFQEEDGSIKIGVTDMFMKTIDEIENITLFTREEEIVQGNTCARIESTDQMIHNILSPISGKIINRNKQVINQRRLIEKDPYFKGWLYVVIPSDLEYEFQNLIPCSSDRV